MILSNDGLVAFHYRSYGTFFLHKIGSIISIGDLPTTNIIEPKLKEVGLYFLQFFLYHELRNYEQDSLHLSGNLKFDL